MNDCQLNMQKKKLTIIIITSLWADGVCVSQKKKNIYKIFSKKKIEYLYSIVEC